MSLYKPTLHSPKWEKSLKLLAMVVLMLMLGVGFSGCTVDDCDCDSEIDDLLNQYGEPDDVDIESADGVQTEIYFYCDPEDLDNDGDTGFVATYEWGDKVSGCCNFSKNSSDCTDTDDDDNGDNGDGNGDNTAPDADDINVTAASGESITITLQATDDDGDALTYSIVSQPDNGEVTDPSGNQVTYTSDDDFEGTDSFTYKANDGTTDSDTATVEIEVSEDGDQAVLAAPNTQEDLVGTIAEDDGGNGSEAQSGSAEVTTTSFSATNLMAFASMLEAEGPDGSIQVFPTFHTGSDGPIIRFTVYGASEIPEVTVETTKSSLAGEVQTTYFMPDVRFTG